MITNCFSIYHSPKAILLNICTMKIQIKKINKNMNVDLSLKDCAVTSSVFLIMVTGSRLQRYFYFIDEYTLL